jgi:hypothetical protein
VNRSLGERVKSALGMGDDKSERSDATKVDATRSTTGSNLGRDSSRDNPTTSTSISH